MTTLILRPAAAADVEEAYDWYEAQRSGLGEEFLAEVQRSLNLIIESPYRFPVVHRQTRRCLLQRFPYQMLYRIVDDRIAVVACMHGKRDPSRWQSRT